MYGADIYLADKVWENYYSYSTHPVHIPIQASIQVMLYDPFYIC